MDHERASGEGTNPWLGKVFQEREGINRSPESRKEITRQASRARVDLTE